MTVAVEPASVSGKAWNRQLTSKPRRDPDPREPIFHQRAETCLIVSSVGLDRDPEGRADHWGQGCLPITSASVDAIGSAFRPLPRP